jgi:hypothetical protein
MSMKRFCDIPQPSSRHRFLLPQTPDDLLFREACSSWAPSGFLPKGRSIIPWSRSIRATPTAQKTGLRPDSRHRNYGVPSLPESNA